jgi:hypothetical protein
MSAFCIMVRFHRPPWKVKTPLAFNSRPIEVNVLCPDRRTSEIAGARAAAQRCLAARRACLASDKLRPNERRDSTHRTELGDHRSARTGRMPRAFNWRATAMAETNPAARISAITGARSAVRAAIFSDLTRRPFANPAGHPPGWGLPSFTPRALAAASAAFMRSDIRRASYSATAASM